MSEALIPVFAGPSLPPEERPAGPFDWRPPAAAGDILALLERPPAKLCLIDGYFGSRPAPWHKEILALMARGTIVLGAASMGALRAAELHSLGMVGIGAIFTAYRDKRIEGDDEVALIHADERLRFAPMTVPMVEIRATLQQACRAGLLRSSDARNIRTSVHGIHFEDRDWPLMEEVCVSEGLLQRAAFKKLRAIHVPLKKIDALSCLREALIAVVPQKPSPAPPATCFIRALEKQL